MRDGLPDMKIECLFEDSLGNLWIGTGAKGVVVYGGDDFVWHTTRDGLSGNSVFGICESDDGTIWLATNRGLCRHGDGDFEALELDQSPSFL